jgi:hypothetical protein
MNRTTLVACLVLLLVAAAAAQSGITAPGSLASSAANSQPGGTAPGSLVPASADNTARHAYVMNYVVRELDGTKVVNQRTYVLNTLARPDRDEYSRFRVGNRVPVGSGNAVSYVDVGVNLDNRVREAGDLLALEVTAEISSIASAKEGVIEPPTVRQIKGTASSLITPGKPTVVFVADDPTSQHRFELEVTATPVR